VAKFGKLSEAGHPYFLIVIGTEPRLPLRRIGRIGEGRMKQKTSHISSRMTLPEEQKYLDSRRARQE
jgi:hypothetical protein